MGEQWNKDSVIEEKQSVIRTIQAPQMKVEISISSIYDIIKTYQSKGKIDENDYRNLILFIISDKNIRNCKELCNYIKELFGEKLKEKHFELFLEWNKSKLNNNTYKVVNDYLIHGIDMDMTGNNKEELYSAIVKLPGLFYSDMFPIKYRKRIDNVLSINEIKENDLTSIADIERETEVSNHLYQKKLTNADLKREILKDIPTDYSDLEKSIYIYIKLCQYLSYDPNYYVNKGMYREIHQSFNNVSKIGRDTNNAVCYEFVTIYSEMLKDLGINVAASTKLDIDADENDEMIYTNFSDEHSNLKYTIDGLLIFADSTTSVLNGDMINAKMNKQLNGLKCLNADQEAKQRFVNAVNKVYQNLQYNNPNFKKYSDDVRRKPLIEKLKILFDDICDANFNPTDFISYITSIKHELFTNDELEWNLKITYIGRNDDGNQYPVALFSVNTNDIKNVQIDTIQYLYDSSKKNLIKVDKDTIEEMFKNGELFSNENINIPNVNLSHKIK